MDVRLRRHAGFRGLGVTIVVDLPIAEFVLARTAEGANLKSALMEHAALVSGARVERTHWRSILVQPVDGGATLAFTSMNGPDSSSVGKLYCDNKMLARDRLMAAGLVKVESGVFPSDDIEQAWKFARQFDSPAVLKPLAMARGKGISTGVTTRGEFEVAFGKVVKARRRGNRFVLVERQFSGDDFRFFVVRDEVVAVTQRRRASVTGHDGYSVGQLIDEKNQVRLENPYLRDCLIPSDLAVLDVLARDGRDLQYVPATGEHVTLRSASNLSAGGDSIDMTDSAHAGFDDIAVRAVAAIPGMAYAGVDIIAPDITVAPDESNHVVGEVEFSPAPLSHFPVIGEPRDMAGAIFAHYTAGRKRRWWRPLAR